MLVRSFLGWVQIAAQLLSGPVSERSRRAAESWSELYSTVVIFGAELAVVFLVERFDIEPFPDFSAK